MALNVLFELYVYVQLKLCDHVLDLLEMIENCCIWSHANSSSYAYVNWISVPVLEKLEIFILVMHCLKNVRIRSCSAPNSIRMRENADQNNSEYGHFLRSDAYEYYYI